MALVIRMQSEESDEVCRYNAYVARRQSVLFSGNVLAGRPKVGRGWQRFIQMMAFEYLRLNK